MSDQREIIENNKSVDLNDHEQETNESCSSLGRVVDQESVIDVRSDVDERTNDLKALEELRDERNISCSIDVKTNDDGHRETVCRICHLGSDISPERFVGTSNTKEPSLVKLGCGCKDELGVGHSHCVETWFKLKGNRICEICGEPARNITVVGEEPRVEQRSYGRRETYIRTPERGGEWWRRGQPCCNFLTALLIVAFILPWFLRVKIL